MYCIFFIHSSTDVVHLGYFHVLALANSAAMEIGGARVFLNHSFLQNYAQKWDCWVILQLRF